MNKNKSIESTAKWSAILLMAVGMLLQYSPALKAAAPEKGITDHGITRAIEDGLLFEKGVFPNDVDVSAGQGIVTLSGSVDNLLAKDRIVKIAESIRGVRGVIDRIAVTPASRPDADIRKDIMTALLHDPATESYQVAVSVEGAVVTLSGAVGSYMEKQLVARIAKGVRGAKEVRNDVIINYAAKRTDKEIDADVKANLQWDIWVNGDLINVKVIDSKVTLTGMVGSAISRSRAYEDAWVNGVMSVDNSGMSIDPWARNDVRKKLKYANVSDGDIKKAVQAALRLDPRVSAFSPDVTVEDGMVMLGGDVGNLKAKNSAEQDAKNTIGVLWVKNYLKVRPKTRPTDAEMKTQLSAALLWDPLLDGSKIEVSVGNSVADLAGTVGSNFQKIEAQDVASRTKGVVSVRNQLKIEPEFLITYYNWPYYSAYDWFSPLSYLSDEQIKKNIENELLWSPYIDKDDIKIAVVGGVATLTGTVGTWVGWNEINNDTYNSGAIEVKNQVKLKNGAWWWW